MVRHFVELFSLSSEEAANLLDRALALKQDDARGHRPPLLGGRTLGLLFEKPSLRTRVSFEAAIAHLGGTTIFLRSEDVGLGVRESVTDFARVISQYIDVLAVRTYAHATVRALAQQATIPVINALSDASHPCQAMADLLTIREALGRTEGVKVVFVGDGNNVARSLAVACALLGAPFTLASPPRYGFPPTFLNRFAKRFPQASLVVEHDPKQAVVDADVVYTDVWASMGQESEVEARRAAFEPYRVDSELLAQARAKAIFLHCLPARRGEEVTDEVLDGPQSWVIPQAANRLHFQKALLLWLMREDQGNPNI